jgi:hypothetical protein
VFEIVERGYPLSSTRELRMAEFSLKGQPGLDWSSEAKGLIFRLRSNGWLAWRRMQSKRAG